MYTLVATIFLLGGSIQTVQVDGFTTQTNCKNSIPAIEKMINEGSLEARGAAAARSVDHKPLRIGSFQSTCIRIR